jgi:hypothetical protein
MWGKGTFSAFSFLEKGGRNEALGIPTCPFSGLVYALEPPPLSGVTPSGQVRLSNKLVVRSMATDSSLTASMVARGH